MVASADLWAYLIRGGSSSSSFKYPSSYTWSRNGNGNADKDAALEALRTAHPTMEAEIGRGVATHYVLTGGKMLWPDTPIPNHVSFPQHAVFSQDIREFREMCPSLLGREATYSDVFWLIWGVYLSLGPRAKRNISVTESISAPVFKFFVDFDLTFSATADNTTWTVFLKSLVKNVAIAMARAFPGISTKDDRDRNLEFVVMYTPYRKKGEDAQKRGIHLVWPNLLVNKDIALVLAVMLEEQLSLSMRRDQSIGENAWRDAIDASVYNTGLRLIGCVKASRCAECSAILKRRGSDKTLRDHVREVQTTICHPESPTGFVLGDDTTVYRFMNLVRSDGVMYGKTEIRARKAEHVYGRFDFSARALTSIRAPADAVPTVGFLKPAHLCAEAEMRDPFRRTSTTIDPVSGEDLDSRRKATAQERMLGSSKELLVDPWLHEKLEEALRRFSPEYRDIIVDRVWGFPISNKAVPLLPLNKNSTVPSCRTKYEKVWVLVKGPGSKYCHNKLGEHGTNRARFQISFKGDVVQSCWSVKPDADGVPCNKATTAKNSKLRYNLYDAYEQLMVRLFASRKRSISDEDQENEDMRLTEEEALRFTFKELDRVRR